MTTPDETDNTGAKRRGREIALKLELSITHDEDGPNLPFDDDNELQAALGRCARRSRQFRDAAARIFEMRVRLNEWRTYVSSAAEALAQLAVYADKENEETFPDTERERKLFLWRLQKELTEPPSAPPTLVPTPNFHKTVRALRRFREARELISAIPGENSDDPLGYLCQRAQWIKETVAALPEGTQQTLRKCLVGERVRKVRENERSQRLAAALLAAPLLGIEPTTFLRRYVDGSPMERACPAKRGRRNASRP